MFNFIFGETESHMEQNTKKNLLRIILLCLLFAVIFYGIIVGFLYFVTRQVNSYLQTSAFKPKSTYTSNDDQFQLSFPSGWNQISNTSIAILWKDSVSDIRLAARNTLGNKYVVVYALSKKETKTGFTVHDYCLYKVSDLKSQTKNAITSDIRNVVIQEQDCCQFEASMTSNLHNYSYLFSVAESNQQFYQITCWTNSLALSTTDKKLFQNITHSFLLGKPN